MIAAPTTICTTNICITQKIQTEYLHLHNTSNLTTEKKPLPFTEHDTQFYYLLSVPEKGLHHDSHSPGVTNTQKCGSSFGFDEFLSDSERLPMRFYVVRLHMGYQVNEIQGVVLKPHSLCSSNCYFLKPLGYINTGYFLLL